MNEVMNGVNNAIMDNFQKTDNILNDVQNIIEVSQKEAYRSVNTILTQRNWLIGYRIAEEELAGEEANIIFGAVIDESLDEDIVITVIATGFEKEDEKVPSIGEITSKSWSPKTSTISSDTSSSSGDLDIPTFLRKNKGK